MGLFSKYLDILNEMIADEEEYLAARGASRLGFGDSALHKNIPYGIVRKRLLDHQLKKDQALMVKRDELRKEYKDKVEAGEVRPPTRFERLWAAAQGSEDNESVQAARRLLTKNWIDWTKPLEVKE
jgi:hypothetical protein